MPPIFIHQQAAPWFKKFFNKGANVDLRPETLPEGVYYDARNMRPSSVLGNTGAVEAVGGEVLLYTSSNPLANTYVCIGVAFVSGHTVSFWCSFDPDNPPIIQADGVVMAMSPLIPYVYNRPLQIAVDEGCRSGILFPADDFSDPLFWDVQKLIDEFNAGSGYFFDGFDPESISVGLNAPAHFPVLARDNGLSGLVDLGGSIGLPVGEYNYAVRYVTPSGDRTNIGLSTPLISVPSTYQPNTNPTSRYPGGRTHGGDPDLLVPTRWGIELKFRVDNQNGYAAMEVVRQRFNGGEGINGPGIVEVIARIPLSSGQFGIIHFIDPSGANTLEVIPSDEVPAQALVIKKPKAVTYANGRLTYANFDTESQNLGLNFREVGGQKMVPITRKLTRIVGGQEVPSGYDDAYNNAYNKKAMSGELYQWGIQTIGADLGRIFAQNGDIIQFPTRRDKKDGDSLVYSDAPCYAKNNDYTGTDPVTATFECMVQGSAKKTDLSSVVTVNIAAPNVFRLADQFTAFDPNPPGNAQIGLISTPNGPGVQVIGANAYQPWHPTDNNDPSSSGYNIPPLAARFPGPVGSTGSVQDTGNIFAPTYHALGGLLYGITNLPPSVKAFQIVRTAPAGRQVCQGIGTYLLQANNSAPATKSTNTLTFYSPDIASGLVDQATLEDIQNNPGNYQFTVTPVGFYTEPYAFYPTVTPPFSTWPPPNSISGLSVDMLTYAGIQWDQGQVNVGDNAPQGYQPTDGEPNGNYVGDKWRSNATMQGNPSLPNYSYLQQTGTGNALFDVTNFAPVTSGRGSFYQLQSSQYIYTPEGSTVGHLTAFDNPTVRTFHQPFFIINIVRTNAVIPQTNSQSYLSTGTNVIVNARIGISTGVPENFELVDERLEDVLPYLGTDFRYIYVQPQGQVEQVYTCITGNDYLSDPTNLALVLTSISGGGWLSPDNKLVKGLYEVINGQVSLGIYGFVPPSGSSIFVRYDPSAPIRVFGWDSTIAPAVFAPYDTTGSGDDASQCFQLQGLPLPYAGVGLNPRWYLPNGGQETQQIIATNCFQSIRQWVIMADLEARTPQALNVNRTSAAGDRQDEAQFFPAVHYVTRPMHGLPFTSGANAGFNPQYDTDYPDEAAIFSKGGIRFLPAFNLDYAKQPNVTSKGFPVSGYDDANATDYCNVLAASTQYNPLSQDSPGLRTFSTDNIKTISEDQGEIKVIASGLGPYGQNMYAWTERGLVRIMTNKSILSGADSGTIGLQAINNYWGEETWLKRNAMGLPDQLWRLWARGVAPSGGGYADQFFWPDRRGWYRLSGDGVDDISRNKYLSKLLPRLQQLPSDYTPQMTGYFNTQHNETWASIATQTIIPPLGPPQVIPGTVYVWSAMTNEWIGEFDYRFDQYLCQDGNVLGFRNLQTYTLDQGSTINDIIRTSSVMTPFIGELGKFKEAVRARIVGTRPDALALYDKDRNLMVRVDQNTIDLNTGQPFGPDWIKRYDSWETFISVVDASYDPTQPNPQDEFFYLEVIYNTIGQKENMSMELQLKNIK